MKSIVLCAQICVVLLVATVSAKDKCSASQVKDTCTDPKYKPVLALLDSARIATKIGPGAHFSTRFKECITSLQGVCEVPKPQCTLPAAADSMTTIKKCLGEITGKNPSTTTGPQSQLRGTTGTTGTTGKYDENTTPDCFKDHCRGKATTAGAAATATTAGAAATATTAGAAADKKCAFEGAKKGSADWCKFNAKMYGCKATLSEECGKGERAGSCKWDGSVCAPNGDHAVGTTPKDGDETSTTTPSDKSSQCAKCLREKYMGEMSKKDADECVKLGCTNPESAAKKVKQFVEKLKETLGIKHGITQSGDFVSVPVEVNFQAGAFACALGKHTSASRCIAGSASNRPSYLPNLTTDKCLEDDEAIKQVKTTIPKLLQAAKANSLECRFEGYVMGGPEKMTKCNTEGQKTHADDCSHIVKYGACRTSYAIRAAAVAVPALEGFTDVCSVGMGYGKNPYINIVCGPKGKGICDKSRKEVFGPISQKKFFTMKNVMERYK